MDALGNPTGFHLTPGQRHDLEGADVLLKDTPGQIVIADKGYDAQTRVVQPLLDKGKEVVIPSLNEQAATRIRPPPVQRASLGGKLLRAFEAVPGHCHAL